MLETAVNDRTKTLGLQDEVTETRTVDADIVTPGEYRMMMKLPRRSPKVDEDRDARARSQTTGTPEHRNRDARGRPCEHR
jgi:hypothetical protein